MISILETGSPIKTGKYTELTEPAHKSVPLFMADILGYLCATPMFQITNVIRVLCFNVRCAKGWQVRILKLPITNCLSINFFLAKNCCVFIQSIGVVFECYRKFG